MKVIGIIAEYNPFHNGHKYQIESLRKVTGADYVVIAMSGNFLQRGTPALCDKYTRARMALSCGADLVLELPSIWATASAEYFAKGGVALLQNTGVVTHLGFGAESNNLSALVSLAEILKKEPDDYKEKLSQELKKGLPFPLARKNALLSLPQLHLSEQDLENILDAPNNILAIEYLKALPDTITPVAIQRSGGAYHDTEIHTQRPSASAIRESLFQNINSLSDNVTLQKALQAAVPTEVWDLLKQALEEQRLLQAEDFASILGYRLLSLQKVGYSEYADCNADLSNKITNLLSTYLGWDNFCQTLKSKDITYTRLSRILLHILLDIRQEDYQLGHSLGYSPYLRILGFRREAGPLLSAIKEQAQVPLISKAADASSLLTPAAYTLLEKDFYASEVYNQILSHKAGKTFSNDYSTPIIIL